MTVDPFATQEKFPSISFKDAPIGTRVTGKVVQTPEMINARDFETGELATWPDGNNKKTVVTGLEINGERYNLWAPKPSAMHAAISAAQEQAGAQIAVGGTLTIIFTEEKPNEKNPRLNAQKIYKAQYVPNDPFAGAPDWAQDPNPQTGEVPMPQTQAAYAQTAPQAAPASAKPQATPAVIKSLMASDPSGQSARAVFPDLTPEILAALANAG